MLLYVGYVHFLLLIAIIYYVSLLFITFWNQPHSSNKADTWTPGSRY